MRRFARGRRTPRVVTSGPPIFVCFDVLHDSDLHARVVARSKSPSRDYRIRGNGTPIRGDAGLGAIFQRVGVRRFHLPFVLHDGSHPAESRERIRGRMEPAAGVVVLCGRYSSESVDQALEVEVALELEKPVFFLAGRVGWPCRLPASAPEGAVLHEFDWGTIERLLTGI